MTEQTQYTYNSSKLSNMLTHLGGAMLGVCCFILILLCAFLSYHSTFVVTYLPIAVLMTLLSFLIYELGLFLDPNYEHKVKLLNKLKHN